ncbi:MAG TPA: multicopper oxidase domain-containing protein [Pseudonocardia sp.]|nr:multicopper oxidase domain-containing protein [Pseudonocardia sp.]
MPELTYHVVALEFPIVYDKDGDHDPNGLLYTLRAYRPLLDWARAHWEADHRLLPRLHRRHQLMQIVVDGLARYERMREKLLAGPKEDRHLLHYRVGDEDDAGRDIDADPEDEPTVGPHLEAGAEDVPEDCTDHDCDSDCERLRRSPRALTVEENLRRTVDELLTALDELTDGEIDRLSPSRATRLAWAVHWQAGLTATAAAIEERLKKIKVDDPVIDALAAQSGLGQQRVRRLLLNDHEDDVRGLAAATPHYDRFNPLRPIPVVRPLVLRAARGDTVEVHFENQVRGRRVGLHVQGEGLGGTYVRANGVLAGSGDGVIYGDGANVGRNASGPGRLGDSTVGFGRTHIYRWEGRHEGVWVLNDMGDVRGTEAGSNVHGLFGAFVVEPEGATWRDPETAELLTGTDFADGLDVDVLMPGEPVDTDEHLAFIDFHSDEVPRSHREYTIFLHDEPEIHSGLHLVGEHSVMPISYRAEPMPNRLPHRMRRYAELTSEEPPVDQEGVDFSAVRIEIDDDLTELFHVARTPEGEFLERVAGEEQHHSSWLFGDPAIPVLRAYKGDPARIRLVHGGVKETHVFHLHVHQWHAVPQDTARPSEWEAGKPRGSQLLDSITIGPQGAVTIDPLYGAGSRQRAPGDIIWHCHLYPHFHHGMWGLWRSFDHRVDGVRHPSYPDGTPCHNLEPLPGRLPDPATASEPGFPWFIDARFPQKAPPPPAVIEEFTVGRRRLLQMPLHSDLEAAAFAPGVVARPRGGMLFVDLDRDSVCWNAEVGLPPPRIVSYDIAVRSGRAEYNSQGWHDRQAHHYQLTGISISQLDEHGDIISTTSHTPPPRTIAPFYPRANHGDIVELRMHNELGSIPADHFDLPQLPVECGLHVHLVKFDVLAADGSSTGFNYLSGGSCREAVPLDGPAPLPPNVGLHRWVVDEEFGPCFFHDHLLANYRQKHGMFAALIAEPFGSQWHLPDQETIAWSGAQAVVVPPAESGLPPYREAGLGVGDFVPLYNRSGRPLNPPGELGGFDDPGVMAVNYRCSPLTFRGRDPSEWFSHRKGEPDTEIVRTYPGERLRIRLIQGSHEEQHSFQTHGLRWRQEWHNNASPLVNQQTLGISEVFTLDLDPAEASPYGPGDHLWLFSAMDDLWLGCWGLVRSLLPSAENFAQLPPLPNLTDRPGVALEQLRTARPVPPHPAPEWGSGAAGVREFVVVASRIEHRYDGTALTDPWGLIYELADGYQDRLLKEGSDRITRHPVGVRRTGEPLVLRAHPGEWVRVMLINDVLPDEAGWENRSRVQPRFGVEPNPPRLPLEHVDDELGQPDRRTVSPRVSLHPSLLSYDVVSDDGAFVGRNADSTVASRPDPELDDGGGHGEHEGGTVVFRHRPGHPHDEPNWREYWWYADDQLAPASHTDGPGQVCYLHDMADLRNHRHHGLIGALVVEPADLTPIHPDADPENLDVDDQAWTGPHALLVDGEGNLVANEQVLLVQDGLRHFVAGQPNLPVPDVEPGADAEDAGQKGINYRCAMAHPAVVLDRNSPPTPIWPAETGQVLWLRLLGAADKPRNHTFTVHGMAWPAARWVDDGPMLGVLSGLTAGTAHNLELRAEHPGDHAYRSGAFRWSVENGLWGVIRVE